MVKHEDERGRQSSTTREVVTPTRKPGRNDGLPDHEGRTFEASGSQSSYIEATRRWEGYSEVTARRRLTLLRAQASRRRALCDVARCG